VFFPKKNKWESFPSHSLDSKASGAIALYIFTSGLFFSQSQNDCFGITIRRPIWIFGKVFV